MSEKVPSNLSKKDTGTGPAGNTRSSGSLLVPPTQKGTSAPVPSPSLNSVSPSVSNNADRSTNGTGAIQNKPVGAYAPGFNPPSSFPSVSTSSSSVSQGSGSTSQASHASSSSTSRRSVPKENKGPKVPSPMRKKRKAEETDDGKMTSGTVYTVGLRDGIQAAFALKSKDQTKHVYSHPLKRIVQMGLSVDAVDKTQICRVVTRRTSTEDNSPLDAGTPISEATRRKFGEGFKRHCNAFLRLIPEEKNTKESLKKFGLKVTKAWNTIGSDSTIYTYPESFHYGGDLTPENPALMQKLGHFAVDEDTIGIILDRYHTYEHSQIADDDSLLTKYFDPNRVLEIAIKIDPGTVQRRRERQAANGGGSTGDDSSELSEYDT